MTKKQRDELIEVFEAIKGNTEHNREVMSFQGCQENNDLARYWIRKLRRLKV